MIAAFYLLALSALMFYINVNTRTGYFHDARWRKNATWYTGWAGLFLSLITAILETVR